MIPEANQKAFDEIQKKIDKLEELSGEIGKVADNFWCDIYDAIYKEIAHLRKQQDNLW